MGKLCARVSAEGSGVGFCEKLELRLQAAGQAGTDRTISRGFCRLSLSTM